MKTLCRLTLAATLALATAGAAEAFPAAPGVAPASPALIDRAAIAVTRTVRRGPRRHAVVTRRVVRHGPLGGRRVTVTKTVR